ncbi:MAG TPA: hypothetical protein VFG59_14305 [Anaeromyxobacter sp.]|nr:hypothetical protein [Anaeromyxobacter sp.]
MEIDVGRWRRREAEAVASLHHPNIITLYDSVTNSSSQYLVLELLGGELVGLEEAARRLRPRRWARRIAPRFGRSGSQGRRWERRGAPRIAGELR